MFRILIVEDYEGTLTQLKKLIEDRFSESEHEATVRIDTAKTVIEGQQCIEAARSRGKPYHVIILDFELPKTEDERARIDESLCFAAKELMPGTLVAHITAYLDDKAVRQHLRSAHEVQIDRSIALSKMDKDYAGQLVRQIKAFVLGRRIEQQLNDIFGASEELSFSARHRYSRARPVSGRSMTYLLADLCRNIQSDWRDLDEEVQARVKRFFRVDGADDKTGPVRVSLPQPTASQ